MVVPLRVRRLDPGRAAQASESPRPSAAAKLVILGGGENQARVAIRDGEAMGDGWAIIATV